MTCQLTNPNSCTTATTALSNPVSVAVQASAPPSVTVITSVTDAVCAGTGITFNAITENTQNSVIYHWLVNGSDAGNNQPNFTSYSLKDGDMVSCSITDAAPCFAGSIGSSPITVHIAPLPEVSFQNSEVKATGTGIQLMPIVTGNIKSYLWEPAAGLSDPASANPVAQPAVTTSYLLTVTTDQGCTASDSIKVSVSPATSTLTIPNTFTPNGDGINDTWQLAFLANNSNCTVNIFNRNGQAVYHSVGYKLAWDGTYHHSNVPSGTYYYVIDLKDGKTPLSGFLTVIR